MDDFAKFFEKIGVVDLKCPDCGNLRTINWVDKFKRNATGIYSQAREKLKCNYCNKKTGINLFPKIVSRTETKPRNIL